MHAWPPQPLFLLLPRELRDLIYLDLLSASRTPCPDTDFHCPPRLLTSTPASQIYLEPSSASRPALLQLKLVNRQVHGEVSETLQREGYADDDHAGDRNANAGANGNLHHERQHPCVEEDSNPSAPGRGPGTRSAASTAKLDLLLRAPSHISPTWVYLPPTKRFPAIVEVRVRITAPFPPSPGQEDNRSTDEGGGHPDPRAQKNAAAYCWPPSLSRALWTYLNHVVTRGPCATMQDQQRERRRRVEEDDDGDGTSSPDGASSSSFFPGLKIESLRFLVLLAPGSLLSATDVFARLERLAGDDVGLGRIGEIEAEVRWVDCQFGGPEAGGRTRGGEGVSEVGGGGEEEDDDGVARRPVEKRQRRIWRLRKFETGLTFPSRVA